MAKSKFKVPEEWDDTLVKLYAGYLDLIGDGKGLADPAAEADSIDYEDPPGEES